MPFRIARPQRDAWLRAMSVAVEEAGLAPTHREQLCNHLETVAWNLTTHVAPRRQRLSVTRSVRLVDRSPWRAAIFTVATNEPRRLSAVRAFFVSLKRSFADFPAAIVSVAEPIRGLPALRRVAFSVTVHAGATGGQVTSGFGSFTDPLRATRTVIRLPGPIVGGASGASGVGPSGVSDPVAPLDLVKARDALGPVFPAASVARTSNTNTPAGSGTVVCGEVHATKVPGCAAVPVRQANVAPGSEVNANVGVASLVCSGGPAPIDTTGATESTVNDRVAATPVLNAASIARTSNVAAPSGNGAGV
ncbi:MAG: hypothetical protein ACRDKY_11190 [Solirubrobacteraceae bacterium]